MGYLSAFLLFWWLGTVYAGAEDFSNEILAIPLPAWGLAGLISLVGGITSIIHKLSKVPPLILVAPRPILGALYMAQIGGAVGFFIGLGIGAKPPYVAIFTFTLALIGAPVLDLLKDRGGDILRIPKPPEQ